MSKKTSTKENKPKTYAERRRSFRKASDNHVLVVEADVDENVRRMLTKYSERLRQLSNELTAELKKQYIQMARTKQYRGIKKEYADVLEQLKKSPKDESLKERKEFLNDEMDELCEKYHVTWNFCRNLAKTLYPYYNVDSIPATTTAEDVWKGIEKVLYQGAKQLHFHKRGDLMSIRAKEIKRTIILHYDKDGVPYFSFYKKKLGLRKDKIDRFISDELQRITAYMANPGGNDRRAVALWENEKNPIMTDTFRPCYATIVLKNIRGKIRVYLHITIEGKAVTKYNKDGEKRHKYGTGRVGCDIGTQTIAWTSDSEVGLCNLAERGDTIRHQERQERLLLRKMDRSRRASNPDNYNKDGTIRKGKKIWVKSKNYLKLQKKHQEYCRKNAESRKFANQTLCNHMRELGDEFITEPKNAAKLMKRAKKTTVNEKTGKYNRKKRFGKSIKNRCPGFFQSNTEKLFTSTGGTYHEVPQNYRASQYDHTTDDYIKKKLNQRMYPLSDGTVVQRDWYSSFLLYNADKEIATVDKELCLRSFESKYSMEQNMIDHIKATHQHILNSGIH